MAVDFKEHKEDFSQENRNLNEENQSLRRIVTQFGNENKSLKKHIVSLEKDIIDMQQNIAILNQENEELKTNLGAYIVLANKKDEYMLNIEKFYALPKWIRLKKKISKQIYKLIKEIKKSQNN